MFVNYAHRGASEYAPENTFSSFYLGIQMGANGIETDVRRTKDGVLVLFHDDTLERVAGISGGIGDYTYSELLSFRIKNQKTFAEDVIVTLEDFLKYLSHHPVQLAIELKERGTEADVLALLDKYGVKEKTVVTSFDFECIKEIKRLDSSYKVGYLAPDFDEDAIREARAIGAEQLCPKAASITADKVNLWHSLGYSVRAWGVTDEALMKSTRDAGVDGMTVNFPDRLASYTGLQY